MASNYPTNFSFHCPVCNIHFDHRNITLLSQSKRKVTFHITCSHCQTATLFVLHYQDKNIMGLGIVTDLDRQEVREKFQENAISSDEVIEVYKEMYYS